MRAILISVSVISLFFNGAIAAEQNVAHEEKTSKYTCSWGVKGAFDVNIPGKWTSTNPDGLDSDHIGYGGGVGVVYNVMKDRHWILETGLMLVYNEFGVGLQKDEVVQSGRISKFDAVVPLTIGYQFDLYDRMRMNVMSGFEGTLCMGGSIGGDAGKYDYSMYGDGGIWRRGDLKWGIGAGFVRDNIEINVMAYFGLINVVKRKDVVRPDVVNENVVRVSCTYFFRQ